MKRAMVIALPALFLVVVVSLGSVSLSSSATTTSPARDVVILICAANFGGPEPVIEVEASNSSSGTPPAQGTSCARGLADTLSAGFAIKDTQPAFNGSGVLYTLVR